jgi:hypothetical protein
MSTQGMIISADQLTVGRELWHIHGHMNRKANKVVITSPICKSPLTDYEYVNVNSYFDDSSYYGDQIFLGDVGIGKIQNMNRIFETEEQALAFYDSEECMQYRYNARRHDFYYDDYPEYEEYNTEMD